jgi:hypothetical protein
MGIHGPLRSADQSEPAAVTAIDPDESHSRASL